MILETVRMIKTMRMTRKTQSKKAAINTVQALVLAGVLLLIFLLLLPSLRDAIMNAFSKIFSFGG